MPEAEAFSYRNLSSASIEASWDTVKNKKPVRTIKKSREENEFLAVLSNSLELFFLNEAGRKVFSMIDGRKKAADIVWELLGSGNEETGITETDLKDFFCRLEQYGLISLKTGDCQIGRGVK